MAAIFGGTYPKNVISELSGVDVSGLLVIPVGFATDSSGNVFIGNYDDNTLSVLCPIATTLYGKSFAANVVTKLDISGSENLNYPASLTFDKAGNLIILDSSSGIAVLPKMTKRFFDVSCAANTITCVGAAYGGTVDFSAYGYFKGIALDSSGRIFFGSISTNDIFILSQTDTNVYGVDISKNTVIPISDLMDITSLNIPTGLAFDSSGNLLIGNFGDSTLSILCPRATTVYGIDCSANTITILDLSGSDNLQFPDVFAFDAQGTLFIGSHNDIQLYVLPRKNTVICNISCAANVITPLGSLDINSVVNNPRGLGFDRAGNLLIGSGSENYISVLPAYILAPPPPPPPSCDYILPNSESQLSPSQRTTLLADSIVYVNASTGQKHIPYWPKFKSGREYLQFKKAKIMSGSQVRPKAIQPSAIVGQLNTVTSSLNLCS